MDKTKLLPVKSDDVFSESRFWEELFFRIGEDGSLRELAGIFGSSTRRFITEYIKMKIKSLSTLRP